MMRKALIVLLGWWYMCFSLCLILSSPSVQATGTTLYVGGIGEGNYTTIQEAVTDATDGDTIYVYDENSPYEENIVIDKSITLQGEDEDTTVIKGSTSGHVVNVYKGDYDYVQCSISGFTIQDASGSGNDCLTFRYVNQGSISDLILKNSGGGDGLQLDHCSYVIVSNNNIYSNDETGIRLVHSQSNTLSNNQLQDHSQNMFLFYSNDNIINDNTISEATKGIDVDYSCSGNIFYHNDFTNNGVHAADIGDNTWWYSNEGNYWDDYTGSDRGDGIGTIPYAKNGVNDTYPLGYFVTPNQRPIATIQSISPSSAPYGSTITFRGYGSDDGEVVAYHWSSDIQGTLSSSPSFSKDNLQIGTHLISFRVRDDEDEWSIIKTQTVSILVPENELPIVTTMTISPQQADFGEPISFYGEGFDTDPTGSIVGYQWSSSLDDVISTERYFTWENLSVGTHLISFKVMDNNGAWSDASQKSVVVSSTATSSNFPPTSLPGGPYEGEVDTQVYFDGSGSHDNDGTIHTYSWDFGDGSTGTGIQVGHTYVSEGNFTLTLQVTDNNGTKSTQTTTVRIYPAGSLPDTSQNDNTNQDTGESPFTINLDSPLLIPLLGVLIFFGIFGGFLLWMKRS